MNEAIEYVEYDFDTAFDRKSIYRGPPSPEIESAWNKLLLRKFLPDVPVRVLTAIVDPVTFPDDKLQFVNRTGGVLDGKELARLEEEPGSPVAANFEVFHQLHCLVGLISDLEAHANSIKVLTCPELSPPIYLARLVLPPS